jgi:hypothetical protein
MTMTAIKPASGKSIAFLASLAENRNLEGFTAGMTKQRRDLWIKLVTALTALKLEGMDADQLNDWMELNGQDQFAQSDVSKFIDQLKVLPYKEHKQDSVEHLATEPGTYKVGDTIFKVQKALNGDHLYAKRLVIHKHEGESAFVEFVYAGSLVKNRITVESKLSYEQAKEFGALYGTCVYCGRLLTNELSIALGVGPVCGGRQFGGQFKFQIINTKLSIGQKLTKGERELIERISADG